MRRFAALVGAFLAVLVWIGPSSSARIAAPDDARGRALEAARVVSVHDGDTITVRLHGVNERVRLVGIDAPEMNDERADYREAAVEARDYARSLLMGKTVTLETDPRQGDRDAYARLLRYVVLSDGTDVNEDLVRKGYARVYDRFQFTRKPEFKKVEKEARGARLGIWRLPPGPAREVPPER